RFAAELARSRSGLLEPLHGAAHSIVKGLSGFGEREATRRSLQQANSELSFEARDRATHARLRVGKRPRRCREAPSLDHLGKDSCIVEGHCRQSSNYVLPITPLVARGATTHSAPRR